MKGLVRWLVRLGMVGFGVLLALIPFELAMRQVVRFNPPVTECDDTYGFRLLTNRTAQDHKPGEFNVTYHTNELGMRYGTVQIDKPEDTWRALGIGDSFTFGMGVEDDETTLAHLEDIIQAEYPISIEVLNAGVPGWGTSQQLLYLENTGVSLNPNLVLVGVFLGNDPNDNIRAGIFELTQEGELRRTAEDTRPTLCTSAVGGLRNLPPYGWLADNSAAMAWLRAQVFALRDGDDDQSAPHTPQQEASPPSNSSDQPSEPPYRLQLTFRLMAELHAWAQAQDIPLVFIIQHPRWTPSAAPEDLLRRSAPWLSACDQNELRCFDTLPVLLQSGQAVDDLYYPQDGHWQPTTHKMVAEALYRYLQEENLLP